MYTDHSAVATDAHSQLWLLVAIYWWSLSLCWCSVLLSCIYTGHSAVATDAHSHSTMASGGLSLSQLYLLVVAMAASGPSNSAVDISAPSMAGAPSRLAMGPSHLADFHVATIVLVCLWGRQVLYHSQLLCLLLFPPTCCYKRSSSSCYLLTSIKQ